jgi:hypothetical protein
MSAAGAVYAARMVDLIRETRDELTEADYEQFLEFASVAIAKAVADQIELRWMGGR